MPTRGRAAERPLRVLHLPAAVGGNPQGLARAERELGLDSRSIVFEASPFGYEADEVLGPADPTLAGRARLELARFRVLARALREADVVHCNFGQSIFPRPIVPGAASVAAAPAPVQHVFRLWSGLLGMRDLGLLRRRGVAVFVTFQGDDVRQADVCRARDAFGPALEVEPTPVELRLDEARRTVARRFDRHANGLWYLNPDLAQVLPPRARFQAYAHVDPREWHAEPRSPRDVPLVVHAPTNRAVKGTHHVLAALDALRAEGVAFELRLVEGLTHDEARRVYAQADLVVDQLLLGWYGGLAVECMALGVPVVAHVRRRDLEVLPPQMAADLPVVDATPATIRDVLRDLLGPRRGELPELGARSRRYVERWHDPLAIARATVAAYAAATGRDVGVW
jgi:hypothetical protein